MASIANTKGIDISSFQTGIDLSKVKAAGYKFVMIRTGQGTRITDSAFSAHVKNAEKAGLPWGVYHFTEACSTEAIKAEVKFIDKLLKAEKAKGYKPSLPIALDVEEEEHIVGGGGWNKANVSNITAVYVKEMRALGYYPMIYSGYYEFLDWVTADTQSKCDFWFAEWGNYPSWNKSNLGIWQYGGETNLIESPYITGVSGKIDKDKAYKDYPTIIKKGGYNGWGKQSSTSTTTSTSKASNAGVSAQLIIDRAYSLVGKDAHPDRCDIMDWYGGFGTAINSVACCCAGMMYLFDKAGALKLIPGGKVADCGSLCKNFYNAGQLHGPKEVKPGDLVIFSWSKERSTYWPASTLGYNTLEHVELCVAVYDSTIKCIGANNGGTECDDFQVKTRNKSNISCCCRPKYSDSTVKVATENTEVKKETGSTIKTVQTWLNSNYKTGIAVDGAYGPKTKAALVKALQKELNKQFGAGLSVDGVFGPKTKSAVVSVYVGSQGNITKTLQGFLICKGYSTNGFDGVFGNGTLNAVKSFQKKSGITTDGIVGPVTWEKLVK